MKNINFEETLNVWKFQKGHGLVLSLAFQIIMGRASRVGTFPVLIRGKKLYTFSLACSSAKLNGPLSSTGFQEQIREGFSN